MRELTRRIIELIKAVPAGRVTSYRDLAWAAGLPNGARQVVRVLHLFSQKENLPWHRVIRADGTIALPAGGGREEQIALLRAEGLTVSDIGRVGKNYFIFDIKPGKLPA
jgi:methylated-DNA-protein-cysteine methyltransferase-like protein